MRGYTALRSWIVLGLVAVLILPLFALCPCGPDATPVASADGMAADHSCCASRAGWQAQEEACCQQMSGPSRESAEATARAASPASPAVLVAAALPAVPAAVAPSRAVSPRPFVSPPASAQPAVLRV
ncbi:MAG: hypothetical protein NDJ94_06660 [Vicinamibacteria bacterium]|nr:hypothetical protein [Vicinamibacteria bacterium]